MLVKFTLRAANSLRLIDAFRILQADWYSKFSAQHGAEKVDDER